MKLNNRNNNYLRSKKQINEDTLIVSEKGGNDSVIFFIIAFCFPVMIYLQTINFKFTYFDDDRIISNNIPFLSNFNNAPQTFLTGAFIGKDEQFYRPLQTLSYMTDIQLSGKNKTWMFHLTNILLLGFVSCLLFLFLRRLLIPARLALSGTLIYCAHPLFVSSVAWIPARGELLLASFSLLSFLFFIELIQKGNIKYIFLNWAAFTIALFSKETAAFLPFLFIIYFFTFCKGKRFETKYIFLIILYAVSGMLWFWLRSRSVSNVSNQGAIMGLAAIMINIRTIPESLAKFFMPYDNAPIPYFSLFKTIAGLGIVVILILLFFRNRERVMKEKIFCFAWFLILMFPPMLYKHPLIDYLDHRFFLPLIGILLFALFLLPRKWFEKANSKSFWLLIALFVILSSFTVIKSRSYSNPMAFYDSAINHNSDCTLAYYNRGNFRNNRGDFQGAIEDYDKAIAIYSANCDVIINRAFAKANLGEKKEAAEDFDKAIATCPSSYLAYYGRGNVKRTQGDFKGAISDFSQAIVINPAYEEAYNTRGVVYYSINNYKDALSDFNKVISINPDNLDAYNSKGIVMGLTGNLQEAMANFNKAIEIDPKYWKAYTNRAFAKYNLKDLNGAIEDCEQALSLNPKDKRAMNIKAKAQQDIQNGMH